jgi:hypothetical protein
MLRAHRGTLEKFTVVAKFEPARSKPLSSETIIDPAIAAWRLETTHTKTFPLFEVPKPDVRGCILTYQADASSDSLEGQAFLEMAVRFADGTELTSRSVHAPLKGSMGWATIEAPLLVEKRPDTVKLNLVVEGKGTVWVRSVSLVAKPLPHRALPSREDIGSRY